jgi:hypothetical protein
LSNGTINFGFQPRPRGHELTDLWRRVLFNAENAPACPCHGIVAGRLDPDSIETNMLAPLRTRYRDSGARDLADFVERRMRKSPFAGLRQPFDAWLGALPDAKLADDERTRLYDDLKTSLSYHAEQQFEFACD